MQELKHILFLLIVINFYLVIRKRNTMSAGQRFMLSLIGVFFTFFALYFIALSFSGSFKYEPGSSFFLIFAINANIVLPIVLTEIILAGYGYIRKK